MPQRIQVPGMGIVEFPDGMSEADIAKAIKANMPAEAPKESAAMTEGRNLPGALRGLASVMQGPTLGWADELAGGLGGAYKALFSGIPFSQGYADTRDLMRGAAAEESANNPIFTGVTRAMAAAPLARVASVFGGPAMTMAGRAGIGAAQGALTGTIAGAGESNANDATGVGIDALKGGAISAAMGGLAVPVAEGLGAVAKRGMAYVRPKVAEAYAKQKVAEALARDAASQGTDAVSGRALARLGTLGDEARVMDAGGQNTRQLTDTLATLPGRTKNAVENAIRERQAGRADRLIGSLEAGLNPSGQRLATTVDNLIQSREQAAKPLYQSLYKQGVTVDDELRGMIEAADKLGAGGAAKQIAIAKQAEYTLGPGTAKTDMRNLDYLKQGLDDIVAANTDAMGKVNKVGAAVMGLKKDLVSKLDDMTGGAYKAARDAFAGPSSLIDAATQGRKALSLDDMSIKQALKGLSDSEAEAFRVGAAEALRAKLGTRSGQTQLMELWREQGMQEKLKAIFGSERSYREFAANVAKERVMKGMESVGRGSQTAARQYGAGDLDMAAVSNAAQTAGSLAHGNVPGAMAGIASAWNRVKTPEPVRDRMGQLLLSQGQEGRQSLLDIEKHLRDVMASRTRNAGIYGLLGPLTLP